METTIPRLNPQLLQDIFLLQRKAVVEKVNAVLDGQSKELCLRTRFPKQVAGFISACLAQRGELESGAGAKCYFIRDRATWQQMCGSDQPTNLILVASPELDLEAARGELLPPARQRGHSVIYSLVNPRPDSAEIVTLNEPKEFEVREVLKKHQFPPADAERLSKRSNGNVYLLTRLLTGTSDRPAWASGESGYQFRCLALLGGWNDASDKDRAALTEILGEPYENWIQKLYPLTKGKEPPVLLEGRAFRPVSRYELWQQLGQFLTDIDLQRFQVAALKVLAEDIPELSVPKSERTFARTQNQSPVYSPALRSGIAESLALLGAQGKQLQCTPNLAPDIANVVVDTLFRKCNWQRWASLDPLLPQLAEAAPMTFIDQVEQALVNLENGPFKQIFADYDDSIFGRSYHVGLLWALEVLAWHEDYLNRVCVALARLAHYSLPKNAGNNPAATLRSIFLTWMPQTLASVDARRAAVECVIREDAAVGWKLLLSVLPDAHQVGSYHLKPAWRDWIPSDWTERVTRSEMFRQVRNYAELAVQIAMTDIAKLTEIIRRWDHLPREIFQSVLNHLDSEKAKELVDADRFAIWQTLTDEIERHRKYEKADWAMPEEELKRLEAAAVAIKPADASVIHQRLFNAYDHTFYVTDKYDEERARVAEMRESAVADILAREGKPRILEMARAVKMPLELGSALGRVGNAELDAFLLPQCLAEDDQPIFNLVRGYIWARYYQASVTWVRELDLSDWTAVQKGLFFANMPFTAELWRLANERLGAEKMEYWKRVFPNAYQARDDLPEAIEQSLQNQRPDIAVQCLNALKHLKQPIPTRLATDAVKTFLLSGKAMSGFDHHDLVNVIKHLQEDLTANPDEVAWIEFQCLRLLDRFSGGSPVVLERKLATEPKFFHDAIIVCYRSEKERDKPKDLGEDKKALAEQTFQLLHNWQTPPGSTSEDTLDEKAFAGWIDDVRKLSEASGHWSISQQMIGHSLVFAPAGLEQILKLPIVAAIVDAPENEHIRRGLQTQLFNNRGVHGFTGGKDELALAKQYREIAGRYDLAKRPRIAATLRDLAANYEREAERESNRDPFGD